MYIHVFTHKIKTHILFTAGDKHQEMLQILFLCSIFESATVISQTQIQIVTHLQKTRLVDLNHGINHLILFFKIKKKPSRCLTFFSHIPPKRILNHNTPPPPPNIQFLFSKKGTLIRTGETKISLTYKCISISHFTSF